MAGRTSGPPEENDGSVADHCSASSESDRAGPCRLGRAPLPGCSIRRRSARALGRVGVCWSRPRGCFGRCWGRRGCCGRTGPSVRDLVRTAPRRITPVKADVAAKAATLGRRSPLGNSRQGTVEVDRSYIARTMHGVASGAGGMGNRLFAAVGLALSVAASGCGPGWQATAGGTGSGYDVYRPEPYLLVLQGTVSARGRGRRGRRPGRSPSSTRPRSCTCRTTPSDTG